MSQITIICNGPLRIHEMHLLIATAKDRRWIKEIQRDLYCVISLLEFHSQNHAILISLLLFSLWRHIFETVAWWRRLRFSRRGGFSAFALLRMCRNMRRLSQMFNCAVTLWLRCPRFGAPSNKFPYGASGKADSITFSSIGPIFLLPLWPLKLNYFSPPT